MQDEEDAVAAITLNPMPPKRGGQLTVTFAPGAIVTMDWTPAGTPTSVKCDQNGQVVITVPANATSLIASDPNGVASPVATMISP